jgi:hypothetical protein
VLHTSKKYVLTVPAFKNAGTPHPTRGKIKIL